MAPYDNLTCIARPIHTHGASTPEEYERLHRSQMIDLRRRFPTIGDVREVPDVVEAYIAGSKWIVDCVVCGNAPSASPEWNVARCFECGAVYRHITWPNDRDHIEHALLLRGNSRQRAWRSPESLDDLRRENAEHGL